MSVRKSRVRYDHPDHPTRAWAWPGTLGLPLDCARSRRGRASRIAAVLAVVALAIGLSLIFARGGGLAAAFTVNASFDEADSDPGDGVCQGIATPGACTLRAAIQEANALAGADTITLPAGIFILTAFHGGDLNVSGFGESLTITGAGASQTIIDGGGIDRVFTVGGLATLEITGVTIRNGNAAGNGGGIFNGGSLRLIDSVLQANVASGDGGGLYNRAGGGIFSAGALTISGGAVTSNTSATIGGGIFSNGGSVDITDATLSQNTAAVHGGGIWALTGVLTMTNSTVTANTAGELGGGIGGIGGNTAMVNLVGGSVSGNTALLAGGGIWIDAGATVTVSDQRGFPGVGIRDIGAFEFQSADTDGAGFDALLAGGADYDDTDPAVFPGAPEIPGDGIDQDCDGEDAALPPSATVTLTLLGSWNTLVFTGPDETAPADLAAQIGPRLDSLWGYGAALQTWLVHRAAGIALLNTLGPIGTGQALFVLISAGPAFTVELPDVLPAGPVSATLLPQWNFLGFTGGDGSDLRDLLAPAVPGVEVAFRFGADAQAGAGFFVAGPSFLNAFTAVNRLSALFVFNGGATLLPIAWEQVSAP